MSLVTSLCWLSEDVVLRLKLGFMRNLQKCNSNFDFWPTVLSVVPLVQCVVCLSSVCDVLYCGKTVRPSQKVSEGVNRKPGLKSSFFGSPPYFYFRFRLYSNRDGRFWLIFYL